MAPHSSTLAWKIPWMEEAAVHGVSKSQTRLSNFPFAFHFLLSCIGKGNGNPLQCYCMENPKDGGTWWAAIYGVAQSRTLQKQLSSSSSSYLKPTQSEVLRMGINNPWLTKSTDDSNTAAAAAAKSLQSCPTLCDPIDGSPPGSPVPEILQARTLEWVAISFSNA